MPRRKLRKRHFFFNAIAVGLITVACTVIAVRAQSPTEAYFVVQQPPRTSTFVFKLTDPAKIQQARTIVATYASKIVSGTIIKQPVYYNPGWSFHFDPKSINFADITVELCDNTAEGIESDLDNSWPQWCPWNGRVLEEIAPPPRPGPGNLDPTVSVTMPYRNNSINPPAPVNVLVDVNADDPDGAISKVEIFTQSFKIGELTTVAAPYRLNWMNLPPGTHSVYAVATDNLGARTVSKAVTFTVKPPPSGNLLDGTDFFVREHYRDFLSREPDEAGLVFWKNNIDTCGADVQCREVRQIDTAAAFFLSIEFQETSYYVHRFYRASFGRRPLFTEFLPQARVVAKDVVVNQPGWPEVLAANKREFAEAWVNGAAFKAIYDPLSNSEFVDKLMTNSGAIFSEAERFAWIAALQGNQKTRSDVLREIVESAPFQRSEFNVAFVEMEYFGFLRRNPEDPPDNDLSGYNFWLDKLNAAGGDYRAAEMVKAFLTSFEYRRRFGAP
jgi:hypothetical protein